MSSAPSTRDTSPRPRARADDDRAPAERCEWCEGPIPEGKRPGTRFCGKGCRQASSRFTLGLRAVLGLDDASSRTSTSAAATRRRSPRRVVVADVSRAMCLAYADPPYPGKAGYYPEAAEVDHEALVARLVADFADGWALSTSAAALQEILTLCPPGVRVCSWHRAVRPTRSRRAISAWEPLIVCGGRELSTDRPQSVCDALTYGGRFRGYPGAIVGMKPPQFAAWMFAQLGARAGDQLVDLFPGSGAVGEAWRRYSGSPPLSLPAAPPALCPTCFGHSEPCAVCVAAADAPAPNDFVLSPGVEQVRRCGCGRVYGAYHAGRALCFVMAAPGRRQVDRCVRCRERLTARSSTDCTTELHAGVDDGRQGDAQADGSERDAPLAARHRPGGVRSDERPEAA